MLYQLLDTVGCEISGCKRCVKYARDRPPAQKVRQVYHLSRRSPLGSAARGAEEELKAAFKLTGFAKDRRELVQSRSAGA